MQVHKPSDTPAGKIAKMPQAAQNIQSKTQLTQTIKSASLHNAREISLHNARSMSSLISSAGLPADKLSASIISFARFFSLPIKPELMAHIRRQAFTHPAKIMSQQTAPSPAPVTAQPAASKLTGTSLNAETFREALSLAAAAAESKGVELQQKGLEAYAQTFDPDWTESKENGGRRQRNKDQSEKEEEKSPPKTFSITAADLKERALEHARGDSLLAILNRLPGKNGQRWIVLPFHFSEGDGYTGGVYTGRDFSVSLRILLDAQSVSNRAALMAMDIKINNERKWLFVMESANEKPARLTVYLSGDAAQNVHSGIKSELSRLLEIEPERLFIKSGCAGIAEAFPCESDCAGGLLREIDEAV
ncbi:MAG: hypothetical protein LBH16_04520 [Treponema sp.]|jgi:hypothetical protein|nr:hypothetical protein [Treponema sp.]